MTFCADLMKRVCRARSLIPRKMMTDSDIALVARAVEGDEGAFQGLMEAHKDMVYSMAYRILGNAEDAQDAFQETFVSAFRNLKKFRGDSKFSTWLYRIALNRSRDILSSRRRRPQHESIHEEGFDHAAADSTDAGTDVQEALSTLPPDYRTAITLRCIMGYTYDEAADMMGIPAGTVKTYVFRGKDELRKVLSPGAAIT